MGTMDVKPHVILRGEVAEAMFVGKWSYGDEGGSTFEYRTTGTDVARQRRTLGVLEVVIILVVVETKKIIFLDFFLKNFSGFSDFRIF